MSTEEHDNASGHDPTQRRRDLHASEGGPRSVFASDDEDIEMVESKDDSTIVKDKESKQKRNKTLIILGFIAVLAVLLAAYLGITQAIENAQQEDREERDAIERIPEGEEEVEFEEGENPLAAMLGDEDAPEHYDGREVINLEDDRFTFSIAEVGIGSSAEDSSLTETSGTQCAISDTEDMCYAGYMQVEDMPRLEVFAIKNIFENRILETMDEAYVYEMEGSDTSVVGDLTVPELETPVIAAGTESGAGFIIMFANDEERSYEDFQHYQDHLEISQ